MGYEIIYSFHERLEEGGYDKDEVKTFKKKAGDPFEEVPLDKLAGVIMAQLSRRDIWIEGVEVYEYSKKQVTFRETKGGIILKNKKFLVDSDVGNIVMQDVQEAPQTALVPHGQPNGPEFHPHNGNQLRPIKWMVFAPELPLMAEVKQRQLRFTMDKKYPIFKEQPHPSGIGMAMTTVDDSGREQLISDKYFIPGEINLVMDRDLGFSQTPRQREGGKLLWGQTVDEPNMPKLR